MPTDDDHARTAGSTGALVEDMTPEEAFGLVAHEMRFDIIRALWDAGNDPLSFSELREAVGSPDAGNFNYHLQRLLGPFVVHEDSDENDGHSNDPAQSRSEGYQLTVVAGRIMGAIESGGYHRSQTVGPVPVDATCPVCDGDVEASYGDDLGRVGCMECGHDLFKAPLPAGAVASYPPAALPDLFDRWIRTIARQVTASICPICSGRLTGTLDVDADAGPDDKPLATFRCGQCDRSVNADIASWFIEHPAVVQFSMNHGVDPRDEPLWSDHWRQNIAVTEHGATDPTVTITLTLQEETLQLTVDETVQVQDATTSEA